MTCCTEYVAMPNPLERRGDDSERGRGLKIAQFDGRKLFYFTVESETRKVAAVLEVVITFCLLANPAKCVDKTFAAGEAATPYQCFSGAELKQVEWLDMHPEYRTEKWTCRRAGLEAKL